MKKILPLFISILPFILSAQEDFVIENPYKEYFEAAYLANPTVPRGVLEAVAFNATRIQHHIPLPETESCIGIPEIYGVMGLTLDGKNYFRNNLLMVSSLSGIPVEEIIQNPASNIMAYAKAYSALKAQKNISGMKIEKQIPVLAALSELPDNGDIQTNFALNAHLYSVLQILNSEHHRSKLHFPKHEIDFESIFGETNYKVLSSPYVIITEEEIRDAQGEKYKRENSLIPNEKSADYGPALWNAAASCNYGVGRSASISAVAIHTVQGSYAGCISWFKNCSANVSAHYVIRSSDGQVTQMVLESNTAYHVGGHNSYTIGIEHEGYVNQSGWYTTALYTASSSLVRDICTSGYGINPATCYNGPACACQQTLSTSIKIKGHQHFSITNGKTDPGIHWNWANFYNMVNNVTTSCGTPSGLSASNITSTGATLNWSAVTGASSYNIQYKTAAGPTWTSTTSSTNSKAISGLSASTNYVFKVQAVCSGTTGSYSSEKTFATSAPPSNATIQVGAGTSPYSAHPFSTVWMDERTQYIITKNELVSAGWNSSQPFLKALAFNITTAASQAMNGFTITIAHTTAANFTNTSFIAGSNATVVFSGTVTATTGWKTFNFSTPFAYNGINNIVITICFNNSVYTSNSAVQAYSYPNFTALYYRADLSSGSVCNQSTGTQSYYRPNIKLTFYSSSNKTDETGEEIELVPAQDDVYVFPNPSTGLFSFLIFSSEEIELTIKGFDATGRLVYDEIAGIVMGQINKSLDMSAFSSGVYYFSFHLGDNIIQKKVVLKK